jgi:hypothetical protein
VDLIGVRHAANDTTGARYGYLSEQAHEEAIEQLEVARDALHGGLQQLQELLPRLEQRARILAVVANDTWRATSRSALPTCASRLCSKSRRRVSRRVRALG